MGAILTPDFIFLIIVRQVSLYQQMATGKKSTIKLKLLEEKIT